MFYDALSNIIIGVYFYCDKSTTHHLIGILIFNAASLFIIDKWLPESPRYSLNKGHKRDLI